MHYRQPTNSTLVISVVSLGTWQLADAEYWGEGGNAEETVRAALDHGITCFDCAESYAGGESERVLGRALGADRDRAVIATKVSPGNLSPDAVVAACEGSLKRLGTDVIDLYQVHWPSRSVPFADTYAALRRLREQGKIREIGVSNFGPRDLATWMETGTAATNQMCYHLLFRAIEFDVVPACDRYGIGVLAYSPIMQGILSGRWKTIEDIPVARRRTRHFASDRAGTRHGVGGHESETLTALSVIDEVARDLCVPMADVAMAWVLAQPGVTSIIVGGRKPGQIARNVRGAALALVPEITVRLGAATDALKQSLGRNPDPWMDGEQSRIR